MSNPCFCISLDKKIFTFDERHNSMYRLAHWLFAKSQIDMRSLCKIFAKALAHCFRIRVGIMSGFRSLFSCKVFNAVFVASIVGMPQNNVECKYVILEYSFTVASIIIFFALKALTKQFALFPHTEPISSRICQSVLGHLFSSFLMKVWFH